MPLLVKIPDNLVMKQDFFDLGQTFMAFGGKNKEGSGNVEYQFSVAGEMKFDELAYSLCESGEGITLDSGSFYAKKPTSEMSDPVPLGWPEGSTGEENEPVSFADYFLQTYDLGDGNTLIKVAYKYHGLSDENRLLYQETLGTLLVKSAGEALVPKPVDP